MDHTRLRIFAFLLSVSPILADVSHRVPSVVTGGSGTVNALQSNDQVTYIAPQGSTVDVGGFTAVGGDISSVVLHVTFSVEAGGYSGSNPIRVNGINTTIIPADGDTQRTASIDITAGSFRIDTWPEITPLKVTFTNNDVDTPQSLQIDHLYLEVTHTTPLFAPPTWSDEFNDSGPPNPAFWTFEQGFVRNSELQWYQSDNAWQQNGNLIIEGRRERVANPNYLASSSDWRRNRQFAEYTSSSIKSQGKYSFKYGRMQVRAKIPCFPGCWPAIWTLGDAGQWPSNGECDVLEYYATDSVLANFATGTNTQWSAKWDAVKKPLNPFFTSTNPNPNWRTEYHIWTMQWDDQSARLYIDNHLMNTASQADLVNPVTTWGPKEPFKQSHYLLLNLALGGAGGNPANTAFPLRYELDYVRVWEGYTSNVAPTDIALTKNTIPAGLPSGTVVGNLVASDTDASEVHSFTLVSGTGSTHNSSFDVVFKSDQTKTSVLRTKSILNAADGMTRSIRVRVTDIEGATFDKILTVQLQGQLVIELDPSSPSVPEGNTNSFNVRLRVAPTQPITVNLSRQGGDSDLSIVSSSQLTFTPENATTWQTVTLAAAEDADRTNGIATFQCVDPSGTYQNAIVEATEVDNEPPPIPVTIQVTNLNQTFNGFQKTVGITTDPPDISHEVTYAGQFMAPADAGDYEVVVTINDPDYIGTVATTMTIAKASQVIQFAELTQVPNTTSTLSLNATSSSGLLVSYTSSNPAVASVSGNTVTINGVGDSIITASQAGDDNRNAAPDVTRTLTVFRVNPLAVVSGPHLVQSNQSLILNGGASQASDGHTIIEYAWDLNRDGVFGDVTGASPSALTISTLINTWNMVDGNNDIALRITDSSGKSATATTNVELVLSLVWDANGATATQIDGSGEWTNSNQWWAGVSNATWQNGDDAIFGSGSTGGTVTLAAPTVVNSLTFEPFTGTYTLGSAGQDMTLSTGITKNAGSGTVSIISPVILGSAQTWTNSSSTPLSVGSATLSNDGFLLGVDGSGMTEISSSIQGVGGISKSGSGTLTLASANSYSGPTNLTLGTLTLTQAAALGTSTLTMANGATLALRNDANTTFIAPIATPNAAVTYNFDVNNAGSAVTGGKLNLGNLTFATSSSGNVTNRINITGGNGFTLGLGTLSTPSNGGSAHPLVIHPTLAGVEISRVVSGSFGTALTFTGSNAAVVNEFVLGSNGNHSVIVNGPNVTLGTTSAINNRSSGSNAYTLTSGTLNLTSVTSLANIKLSGTDSTRAPTLAINGGTLNNTSGAALTLGGIVSSRQNNRPTITLGGNFAFGTAESTSANNLDLGTIAMSLTANRIITINGATNLTIGGVVSGGSALTKNGTGNITFSGQNTYTGNTSVGGGTMVISAAGSIYSGGYIATPTVTVSSGATLQLAAWAYGANGGIKNLDVAAARLIINGGTITYTGDGEGAGNQNNGRLFTVGTGGATLNAAGTGTWFIEPYPSYDSTTGQVIPSNRSLTLTGASSGRYAKRLSGAGTLNKTGIGSWTLAGENTYTGATTITDGTLFITGATQNTTAVNIASGASLGLVIGSPVNASGAVVNLSNGNVTVSGTPTALSHLLLTAQSFTGEPILSSPIPGYELKIVGNQLQLLHSVTALYDLWKVQITNGRNLPSDDADNDGVVNAMEYAFGTNPNGAAGALSYTAGGALAVAGLPIAQNLAVGEGVDYRAVFTRRKDHITAGLTYVVQFSAGLDIWQNSMEIPVVLTAADSANPSEMEVVSVPYPLFIEAGDGFRKPTFFRVTVTLSH